jgi:hypothetical protein
VEVTIEPPGAMEWLQLLAGSRNTGLRSTSSTITAGVMSPHPADAAPVDVGAIPPEDRVPLLQTRAMFSHGCDPLRLPLHAYAGDRGRGEAQVLRARQQLDGEVVGGYTVVLLGPP